MKKIRKLTAAWRPIAARCRGARPFTSLLALTVIFVAAVLTLSLAYKPLSAAEIYVRQVGVPYPDGSETKPYQVVEQAVFNASYAPNSTIWVAPGEYYESFTIDTPCQIKATSGGNAYIGNIAYSSATDFKLITLNALMFGDMYSSDPAWQDVQRAGDIAAIVSGLDPRPDVIAFQELWDQDLFYDVIRPGSGYSTGIHGDGKCDLTSIYNSGLAYLNRYPLSSYEQVCWDDCSDTQCWTSKGWLRATFDLFGFDITVFNLHMQAYSEIEDVNVRIAQMDQLVAGVTDWRTTHPDHVVFVVGDFNIIAGSSEYHMTMVGDLGFWGIGGTDSYPDGPATYSTSNPLALYVADGWAGDNYPFPPNHQRIDYICYFPSLNGSVGINSESVEVLPFRGVYRTEGGLTTNEKSDHWSVRGRYKLVLK